MDEALQPGVVKLFLKEINDKSDRIKLLENKLDRVQNNNVDLEKKVAVLETEDKYKIFREIILALSGIAGGATIAFWNQPLIARVLGITTIVLFITYAFIRVKK